MADDRKRGKRYDRFARPPTSPEAFDPDKTPVPQTLDQAIQWHHVDTRLESVEAEIKGYTKQVTRHQAELDQWVPKLKECIGDIEAATNRQARIEAHLEAFFDREWPSLRKALGDFADSIRDLGDRMTSLEKSVEHVGEKQSTQAKELDALEMRVKALETISLEKGAAVKERRRLLNTTHAVIAAVAAAAGYIASLLT